MEKFINLIPGDKIYRFDPSGPPFFYEYNILQKEKFSKTGIMFQIELNSRFYVEGNLSWSIRLGGLYITPSNAPKFYRPLWKRKKQ